MTRVALLGRPVRESLSPRMQNAAFEAAGLDWEYVALEVEPEALEETVHALAAGGYAGANVTIPHKQAAAHPARVNYLYFVRKPDKKHHFFTASFAEFERYKAEHGYP